jgi:hypothetical protein
MRQKLLALFRAHGEDEVFGAAPGSSQALEERTFV